MLIKHLSSRPSPSHLTMGYHLRSLLLVAVLGAAAMAATEEDAMPPIPEFHMDFPPLPSPADIPVPPPCLDSLSVPCQSVTTKDSPMLAPCCAAFKKLFKSDTTCVCDAVGQAQKIAKEYKLNGTFDGLETFRLCDMPTTSCEPGKPGSQNTGNAASYGRSLGSFQIMLLLPLFCMLLL